MRYTIGARIIETDGKTSDGIYAYNKYGLSCILTSDKITPNSYRIPVFSDLSEAEDYVKSLCKSFRKEFHSRANKHHFDISQFRFFLVKVDSSKFKRKLVSVAQQKKQTKYLTLKLYFVE